MAGKADLVNSIVDSVEGMTRLTADVQQMEAGAEGIRRIKAEMYSEDWAYASLSAGAAAD